METKIINILNFFIHGICKSDMGYLDIYMLFIYSFAVKKVIQILKRSIFRVLKIGFQGDTFVAREHNTNGMFRFSLLFVYN